MTPLALRWLQHAKVCALGTGTDGTRNVVGRECAMAVPNVLVGVQFCACINTLSNIIFLVTTYFLLLHSHPITSPVTYARRAETYYYDRDYDENGHDYDENSRFIHVKLLCVCAVSMHIIMTPLELRWLQHAKIRAFQCTKHGRPNAGGKVVEAAPNVLVSV